MYLMEQVSHFSDVCKGVSFQNSLDTKYGKLYVSDSSGSRFTLSLSSHLYEVHYHPMGHYSVHDFYEVKSARGVYITSSVDNGKVKAVELP